VYINYVLYKFMTYLITYIKYHKFTGDDDYNDIRNASSLSTFHAKLKTHFFTVACS